MHTLQECAATLTRLFIERKTLAVSLEHVQAELNSRQLALTPPEGWFGKNESQRDTTRDFMLANDKDYQELGQALSGIRDTLADTEAVIAGVQETASAERWRIRELLATALMDRTQGERVEDAAPGSPEFGQAAQAETDRVLEPSANTDIYITPI
jgi:hypothetical protein